VRLRSRVSVVLALGATGLAAATIVVPRAGSGEAAAAVTAAQAASPAAAIVPYTPYPYTGTELYVDDETKGCSDSGTGSDSQPFCTIAAAAAAVQPGQTVVVEPGTYAGTTISVQGTPAAPITFNAVQGATVQGTASAPHAFAISGAHDVVLDGFSGFPGGVGQAFDVTGSSGITINGGYAAAVSTVPGIEIDGTSSDVTVSRMAMEGRVPVQVDPGASGVVITGNTILPDLVGTWGVLVTSAQGTDVVGNTIHTICSGGISLAGTSPGSTVENNIVQPTGAGSGQGGCTAGTAISVSSGSEASTVVGYNLIDPSAGEPLYNWGGTSYTSLTGFQEASGQGTNDTVANPGLGTEQFDDLYLVPRQNVFFYPLQSTSPAIDSADASAPGELPSDQFGNPRVDDPSVTNKGTGPGYYDRGAAEYNDGAGYSGGPIATSTGPLTATFSLGTPAGWTANGAPEITEVNFGDGTPAEIARANTIQHTYRIAGAYGVQYSMSEGCCGMESSSTAVAVGADYTPVTPDRILDTRNGTGTGKAAPVAAGGTLTLPITSIGNVPAADISAVVMNVTVTKPARSGNLTVYPGSGAVPGVSNLNFSAGETVPNLVTVRLSDGEVSFHNASGGTVEVIADLEGFYGTGGDGFKPVSPTRVLDTRNGTGTGKAAPVAAGGTLALTIPTIGNVPAADMSAVVMNVTVTQPKHGGNLTVYPGGTAEPITSNLNFSAGETVPNLVIVPLTDGVADFTNNSGGTVQVVADLEGYFASGAPDSFVPLGPTREVDTRTVHSPLTPREKYTVNILSACPDYITCTRAAMVDNVTVTQPAKGGVLTVYPAGASVPVASNLNFKAGETVPNLTTVQGGTNGQITFYNNSPGTVQLIVDEFGYYMTAS